MDVIIYNSEAEMPHYLRKEKNNNWNILDQADWDEWNFVPTSSPQKSKYGHVTWNSHRTDYFNKMNIKIAEETAAKTRIAIDNKIGTTADYDKELADALAEEKLWEEEEAAEAFEALQAQLEADEYKNTILPTPEPYTGFVKLTDAEKRERRRIRDRRDYKKNKAKRMEVNKESVYEFCDFCGGEHRATPQGRNNHQLTQIHTTKVLRTNICNYYIKRHTNIKNIEQAEQKLDNIIKTNEQSLCITYTGTTLKNKYKKLWAQYICNL